MLANALSFANQSGPAAGTAGQPPQMQQTPQTSAGMQFSRLLDQQATQRRDAERSEANKAARRERPARPPGSEPVPTPDAPADPVSKQAAAEQAGGSALHKARQQTSTPPPMEDPNAPTHASAGGRPVNANPDGSAEVTGSTGCFPDDTKEDLGCEATPLALLAGLSPTSAAAMTPAGMERAAANAGSQIKRGPGQAPDGTPADGSERTARHGGALSAAGAHTPLTTREDRPHKLHVPEDEIGAAAGQPIDAGHDALSLGTDSAKSFAPELQALLPAGAATAADTALAASGAPTYIATDAPTDVPTGSRLHASPGTPEFASALGAQLSTFVANGVHHARLELNPADMGPLTVQIQLDGQNAQVHLAAQNADTRLALEQAMPQLAGSLRESGLTLSGGGVYEQPQPQPQQASAGNGSDPQRSHRTPLLPGAVSGGADVQARAAAAPARRGVVDLVA